MSIQEAIKSAAPGSVIWDKGERASVKGLHLRTLDSGKKVFFLYYRTKAHDQRRPKLGEYPTLTLPKAREIARGWLLEVAQGKDPSDARQAAREEMTVEELFQLTWTEHWDKPRFRKSGWAKEASRNYHNHLQATFGKKRLSDVDVEAVRAWHEGMSATPTAGNRSLEVFSKMFRFAMSRPKATGYKGGNPCSLVKAYKEKKRKRFATEEEIAKIGAILAREAEANLHGAAYVYLLMYTGSRPRAVEQMGWEQLQRVEGNGRPFGILTFHGKTTEETGEEEMVILPPQAMHVVDRLPKIEGQPIVGCKRPKRLWNKIKKEVGCTDLWLRDWRRTFGTVGLSGGVGLDIIGELLNHRDPSTTKIYAKLMQGARVQAAFQIASRMENLLQGGAKVIALPEKTTEAKEEKAS